MSGRAGSTGVERKTRHGPTGPRRGIRASFPIGDARCGPEIDCSASCCRPTCPTYGGQPGGRPAPASSRGRRPASSIGYRSTLQGLCAPAPASPLRDAARGGGARGPGPCSEGRLLGHALVRRPPVRCRSKTAVSRSELSLVRRPLGRTAPASSRWSRPVIGQTNRGLSPPLDGASPVTVWGAPVEGAAYAAPSSSASEPARRWHRPAGGRPPRPHEKDTPRR